jgi:hypothetical protein
MAMVGTAAMAVTVAPARAAEAAAETAVTEVTEAPAATAERPEQAAEVLEPPAEPSVTTEESWVASPRDHLEAIRAHLRR